MPKVKIKKLPDGFVINNGTVEQTMQNGGYVTGQQKDYGLVTTGNNNNTEIPSLNVRSSLSSVPRQFANLEAEGGETVLTDLNDDGQFGLYNINGPRHSNGGVPMNLPDQSFIFSDTRKLKLNSRDLKEFDINSRKKMTPAKVSKKYDLNKYYGSIRDEHADKIQVDSAELMIDKNKKSLSKLAFVQESKKNFEDGVPVTAYPYLMSQGIDPMQFTQQVNKNKFALTEFTGDMPMANKGLETNGDPKKRNKAINPEFNNELKSYGITLNTDGINETNYRNVQQYKGDGLYGDGKSNLEGFAQRWGDIYGKENMNNLLDSIGNYKVGQVNPEVKKFQSWVNNEYIPSKVKQINQERIDKGYEPLNDEETSVFQNKLLKTYGFPGKGFGSGVDGLMGTYTSSRIPIDYKLKQLEQPEPPAPIEEEPVVINDPQLGATRKAPDANFWLQDMLQLNAIANRERDMFLPYQPGVKNNEIGYVLEDPTRAIAATNEQLNLQNQALGAFAGPQSQSARMAQGQARAAANIANELARVNQRNVGTVNRGLARQAQMDAMLDRERRERVVKQYDDTQSVLQNYMDEKNFDRESYANTLANAITNRANTYNLNSIQDYYQIDPTTGGMIGQFSSKAFEPTKPSDPFSGIQNIADLQAAYIAKTGNPLPDSVIEKMLLGNSAGSNISNARQAYERNQPGYRKNGGSVGSLPFYIGKIGN